MDEPRREEQEVGQKGGAAEAHAVPGGYALAEPVVTFVRAIHWDAVVAGLFVSLASMMLLTSLGVAIGLTFGRMGLGGGLAYWVVGAATVGLFLGASLATRYGNISNVLTAIAHGVVIWSLFMILDRLGVDLVGGISRFLTIGVATGGINAATAHSTMTGAAWWFFIGYIIALAGAILGAISGLTVEERRERRV